MRCGTRRAILRECQVDAGNRDRFRSRKGGLSGPLAFSRTATFRCAMLASITSALHPDSSPVTRPQRAGSDLGSASGGEGEECRWGDQH